jgi:hypothetical protein
MPSLGLTVVMARRIRRILAAIAIVLVAGAVVLVIVVRPGLRDDSESVSKAWKPLIRPLGARYAALGGVAGALEQAGAGDREVTVQIRKELSDWDLLQSTTDAAAQAQAANELEGLAARARATVASFARLRDNAGLKQAIQSFDGTTPPPKTVEEYNAIVVDYEQARDGFWNRIVAGLDGYDSRPTLQLAPTAA